MASSFFPATDMKLYQQLAPVAITAASTSAQAGTGAQLNGYDWVVGIFNIGVVAASQAGSICIQDSADDSTYATVTGAAIAYTNTGSDGLSYMIAVKRSACRAFVRTNITTTTADSIVMSHQMLGVNGPVLPITQTSATVGVAVVVTSV